MRTVGSKCKIELQKQDGSKSVVVLTRMSTQEVFDIKVFAPAFLLLIECIEILCIIATYPISVSQVIFDNFAKMLKMCLKSNNQDIADTVLDTRMVWEMCLHSEHEVSTSSYSTHTHTQLYYLFHIPFDVTCQDPDIVKHARREQLTLHSSSTPSFLLLSLCHFCKTSTASF